MIIPDMPADHRIVDINGHITDHWRTFFHLLTQQLQRKTSESGIIMPTRPQGTITKFLDKPANIGGLVYDNDSKNIRGNMEGKYNPMLDLQQKTGAEIAAIPATQRDGHIYHATDVAAPNDLKIGFKGEIKTLTYS